MKNVLKILFLLVIAMGGYWAWQQSLSGNSPKEISFESNVVIKKSNNAQVKEIDEEVLDYNDRDYETLTLELFPAEGYVGKDLYDRLSQYQRWLDSLKIFIVKKLGLEVRVYAEYIEFRYYYIQKKLQVREKLKKRYGDFKAFSKAYLDESDLINTEYLEKIEELFEDNFDQLVKFNKNFNDKIKNEKIDRYSDVPVSVDI